MTLFAGRPYISMNMAFFNSLRRARPSRAPPAQRTHVRTVETDTYAPALARTPFQAITWPQRVKAISGCGPFIFAP